MMLLFSHWKHQAAAIAALALFLTNAAESAPPSAAWQVAWSDEFNDTALDTAKWSWGELPWGGRHHNDQYASYIMPEDSYEQGGSLWLRCRRATGTEFGGYPWSEGFVHSNGKKNYTYGYVEIRARCPLGKGIWPAFWTLSQGWPPEFDIAEYFGTEDRMHMGLAYGTSWQDVRWDSSNLYGEGFANWHSYGLEWGPGYAIWYKDGLVRKSIAATYVPSSPMYVILNSGMRPDADGSSPDPNYFEVDYCRLYALPPVRVNDNTLGTGLNQFNYVGTWGYNGTEAAAFLNDNHWSGTANDSFQVVFSGTRVDLYGARAPNHGIAAVSVDGAPEVLVDYYAASRTDKSLVWSSPGLTPTAHVLRVRVTGTRNTASTGTAVPADRVDVWQTAGRLGGTLIGTTGSWNNAGNTRDKAMDGDLETFFDAPTAAGAWAGLDVGSASRKRVTKVRFCPRPGYASRMVGGQFQGANTADFSSPATLWTVTAAPLEGTMTEQTVTVTTGFRYLRYWAPSGYGNVAEVEFYGQDANPPPAPVGLAAAPGDGRVTLTWQASLGATGYNLKRANAAGGPFTSFYTGPATQYTDAAASNLTTYYYVVSAANPSGESPDSSVVSAMPHPPLVMGISFLSGQDQLSLSWPSWATGYSVFAATNLEPPVQWLPLGGVPESNSAGFRLLLPVTNRGSAFYRLGPP